MDATSFGTTVVKVRSRSELNMILERMDNDEGVLLLKDLTFDYEFLEEGRSLALVDKEGCDSKSAMFEVIAKDHEEQDDGKFVPPVQFSFFHKQSVEKSVAAIAKTLGANQKAKEEREFHEDAYEEAGIGKDEKFQYGVQGRDWEVPELTGKDARQGDERYVAGGAPRELGNSAPIATASVGGAPIHKKITKYMTGDPMTDTKRVQKVYVEEDEVVNCDESHITVEFKQTSYSVQAMSPSATYVLGPIECGHIVPSQSSWRLSKGKRLTITLRGTQPEVHPAVQAKAEMAASVSNSYLFAGLMVFISVLFFLLFIGPIK